MLSILNTKHLMSESKVQDCMDRIRELEQRLRWSEWQHRQIETLMAQGGLLKGGPVDHGHSDLERDLLLRRQPGDPPAQGDRGFGPFDRDRDRDRDSGSRTTIMVVLAVLFIAAIAGAVGVAVYNQKK